MLPVVYVSGYTAESAHASGPRDLFVEKPFTAAALLDALRRAFTGDRRAVPR